MAALASKNFIIDISNSTDPISRASRRIIINSELLKQARVYAGDIVAISSDSSKVRFLCLALSYSACTFRRFLTQA